MKTASGTLQTFLGANKNFAMADLWALNLNNGLNFYWTSADVNLTVGGKTYLSHQIILSGGKFKQIRGLEVNECDLVCYDFNQQSGSPTLVGSLPFLQAVRAGLFDRATVNRYRLFLNETNGVPNWSDVSLGAVLIFTGEVTEVEVTRNTATLKCKDATNLLNIYMPRRLYQPSCPWTFGDSNCKFNVSSLSVSSSVTAGSYGVQIYCGLSQAAGYFNYGVVTFTSGINNGISRSVKSYSPGLISLTGPFPSQAATGDTFTITPGCSKTLAGPVQTFNASVNGTGSAQYITMTNCVALIIGYNIIGHYLRFTSGVNNGKYSTIVAATGGSNGDTVTVNPPFDNSPVNGDSFEWTEDTAGSIVVLTGNVGVTVSTSAIPTSLNMASGFFNGGSLLFTSGANVGQSRTISTWANGTATVSSPFSNVPTIGDSMTLTTVPANTPNTCTGYANTANYGGQNNVPVPETAY